MDVPSCAAKPVDAALGYVIRLCNGDEAHILLYTCGFPVRSGSWTRVPEQVSLAIWSPLEQPLYSFAALAYK